MNVKIKSNNSLIILIYLFMLQSIINFNYLDEIYALLGIVISFVKICSTGKLHIKKKILYNLIPFFIFILVGILGNVIYKYQSVMVVLTDLLTNVKFYLSIYTTMVLLTNVNYEADTKEVSRHTRIIVLCLFVLLVVNYIVPIFPASEVRYGINSAVLFFEHPTYLAGYASFLLSLLTFFYKKENNVYICMALVLLVSTLRGKAIGAALAYCVIYMIVLIYKKKLKWWHIIFVGILALYVAWEQIYFYYIQLSGSSARSVITQTAFQIAKDYFPIGTGFGTYASHAAGEYYSPVYRKYGFDMIYELSSSNNTAFYNDTFWPIIIGQTGIIGTISYMVYLIALFIKTLSVRLINRHAYATILFIFAYLIISSTSEPAFNNVISIPLTILIGYALKLIAQKNTNG